MSHPVIERVRQRTLGHGQHRMVDENARLQYQLDKSSAANDELRRLQEATDARDAANAKASRLGDVELRVAEATQMLRDQTAELLELRAFHANATAVSDLGSHPAVTEMQPIPVLTLSDAARWGYLK